MPPDVSGRARTVALVRCDNGGPVLPQLTGDSGTARYIALVFRYLNVSPYHIEPAHPLWHNEDGSCVPAKFQHSSLWA